jgi:hypothetical protein
VTTEQLDRAHAWITGLAKTHEQDIRYT